MRKNCLLKRCKFRFFPVEMQAGRLFFASAPGLQRGKLPWFSANRAYLPPEATGHCAPMNPAEPAKWLKRIEPAEKKLSWNFPSKTNAKHRMRWTRLLFTTHGTASWSFFPGRWKSHLIAKRYAAYCQAICNTLPSDKQQAFYREVRSRHIYLYINV